MKSSEGGVQITVFAAWKLGNVIAMRAFRRVFRLFSCLFDDCFLRYVADCEGVNAFRKVGKGEFARGFGRFRGGIA